MSNYELNKHKAKDKIKWVFTGIAFLLVFVMLAGMCLQIFGKGKVKPSEWFKKPETEQTTPAVSDGENKTTGGGMEIAPVTTARAMRVTAKALAASANDNDGISPQAENSYTLTATVTPDNATDKTVNWRVAWKNPSSSFASGKKVTDYVTVTPTTDGALTARVDCLQAFGEQVNITVTSRDNVDATATCVCDYVARITDIGFLNVTLTEKDNTVRPMYLCTDTLASSVLGLTIAERGSAITVNKSYSAYTKQENLTETVTISGVSFDSSVTTSSKEYSVGDVFSSDLILPTPLMCYTVQNIDKTYVNPYLNLGAFRWSDKIAQYANQVKPMYTITYKAVSEHTSYTESYTISCYFYNGVSSLSMQDSLTF